MSYLKRGIPVKENPVGDDMADVLVCDDCGAIVLHTSQHTAWHEAQAGVPSAAEDAPRESYTACVDALHRIVDRCTWRLSKKPSARREGAEVTLENVHEIATEALRAVRLERIGGAAVGPGDGEGVAGSNPSVAGQVALEEPAPSLSPDAVTNPVCVCGCSLTEHTARVGEGKGCKHHISCSEFRSAVDVSTPSELEQRWDAAHAIGFREGYRAAVERYGKSGTDGPGKAASVSAVAERWEDYLPDDIDAMLAELEHTLSEACTQTKNQNVIAARTWVGQIREARSAVSQPTPERQESERERLARQNEDDDGF